MKSLEVIDEVLKNFERYHGGVMRNKVEEEACMLTTSLAKALSSSETETQDRRLGAATESALGLISLIDLAKNTSALDQAQTEQLINHLQQLQQDIANFKKHQKKVLILYSQIGQGHISAAKAVYEAIRHLYGYDIDVETIDFMDFMSSGLTRVTQKTYDGSTKFAPVLVKLFFESTDKRWPIKLLNQLNYPFALNKLKKFFDEKKPDVIVSTFPLWDCMTAEIWKKNYKNAKFISIITDSITIHNGWVIADSDYHIVANEDTARSLRELDVNEKKIKILGFPVRIDFLQSFDRKQFLSNHGLNPDLFTVLFLPAAQNPRRNIKIIKELTRQVQDFNLIVITGRDPKIRPKMEKLTAGKNIKIIGWTDSMPLFIKAADVVVTKAGGATVMECIAAERPMVITSMIPGQEQGNAELIRRYDLGIIAPSANMGISESIDYVRKNYGTFIKNLKKVSNPQAALKIAEFIHELLGNIN